MEIDDTFKNKPSATFGKKRITHLKGGEKESSNLPKQSFYLLSYLQFSV